MDDGRSERGSATGSGARALEPRRSRRKKRDRRDDDMLAQRCRRDLLMVMDDNLETVDDVSADHDASPAMMISGA